MSEPLQNSYLQRYELAHNSRSAHSLSKSNTRVSAPTSDLIQANTMASVVSKLQQRVDCIDVKITSIVNVVKLLQRYSETRDDQYEKEKENQFFKNKPTNDCNHHCLQIQSKARQFDSLSKQFREQLKHLEKIKSGLVFPEIHQKTTVSRIPNFDLQKIEANLREELNRKMQICIKLINSNSGNKFENGLTQKINDISFSLNQLQNECKRNKMLFQKQIDRLCVFLKDNKSIPTKQSRTVVKEVSPLPNFSRRTDTDLSSKSPLKSKSKNSKSDKSLSRGKQNKSVVLTKQANGVSRIRQEEMQQALRKRRQNKQRLKVRNF